MGKAGYYGFLACCLSLLGSGCSVPYFASVRGPIRAIRVLDAESGEDIPEAKVALTSQTSAIPWPAAVLVDVSRSERASGGHVARGLLRNADLSFHASSGLGMGSWGFFTGRPEDPNEYPRGFVVVDARLSAGHAPLYGGTNRSGVVLRRKQRVIRRDGAVGQRTDAACR